MAVLIDPPSWPAHGRLWSHLVSDGSLAELHAFADRAGVPARGFEGDHYDVPEDRYADLVAAGAEPVSGRDLVRRLLASGLRRRKRHGERVVASVVRGGAVGHERVDAVLSGLAVPGHVRAVLLVVQAPGPSGPSVLVDAAAGDLPTATVGSTDGPDVDRAVDILGGEMFGRTWSDAAPADRLGHLRRTPAAGQGPGEPDSPGPAQVDVVVRRRLAEATAVTPPLRWLGALEAVAVLPAELGALLTFARGPAARPR